MFLDKTHFTTIFLTFLLAFISCKKENKVNSEVDIRVTNPVTGEIYSGVDYSLKKYKKIGSGSILFAENDENSTQVIKSGTTVSTGSVIFNFEKEKQSRFTYGLQLDFSDFDGPPGDYEIVSGNDRYNLEFHTKTHEIDVELVPHFTYYLHIKDTACTTSNDKMRFKDKRIYNLESNNEEFPISWIPSPNWTSGYYESCANEINSVNGKMEYGIFKKEVTRDGQVTIYQDTVLISPQLDTLKLYY